MFLFSLRSLFKKIYPPIFYLVLLFSIPQIITAQYVQMNGPYGGRVNCVSATYHAVFAGTEGGGFYKSIDQGQNWQQTGNGIINKFIRAVEVLANHVVVAAAPDGFGLQNAGLYYSTDTGKTWSPSSLVPFNSCNTLFVDGNVFYGGTNTGLYFSLDYGDTWSLVSNDLNGIQVNSITKIDSAFFIGTDQGVYVSSNNLNNWTPSNAGLSDLNIVNIISKGNDLYVSVLSIYIYVSHDLGQNWNQLTIRSARIFVSNNRLFVNSGVAYYSNDDAQTWNPSNLHADCYSMASDGNKMYAGSWDGLNNGVSVSSDSGRTWSISNSGIIATHVFHLLKTGNRILAGTLNDGMFASDDGGSNWNAKNNSLTHAAVYSLRKEGNLIYCGTYGAGIFASTDSGETWQQMNHQPPDTAIFDCNLQGPDICSFSNYGNFFSADSGLTWDTINSLPNIQIFKLYNFNNRLFTLPTNNGIYYSDDAGASWTLTFAATGTYYNMSETIYGLITSSALGIFLSVDNGINWNCISNFVGLEKYFNKDNQFYALNGYADLFISNDTGARWGSIFFTNQQHQFWDYFINENDLIISYFASGVWKYDMSNLVSTEEIQKENALIFPNPFSDEFTVLLPKSDRIKNIIISDALGRIVENILSPKQIIINTYNLDKGFYILKIETDNGKVFSKKITCVE